MGKTYEHIDFSSGDTCFIQMPMNCYNTQKSVIQTIGMTHTHSNSRLDFLLQ